MASRRKVLVGCLSGVVVVSLVLGGVGVFASQIPTVDEQLPPDSAHISVTLKQPANGETYPQNVAIPLHAVAAADMPIASIEFWVNDNRAQVFQASPGLVDGEFSAEWKWLPGEMGEYVLFARAFDAQGSVGTSNSVHLVATQAIGARFMYTPKAENTLEGVAQTFGTTTEAILADNPGLDPHAPLPVDQPISISVEPSAWPASSGQPPAPTPSPSLGQAMPVSDGGPNAILLWLQNNLLPANNLPISPSLTATVKGCKAEILINDQSNNEAGFFVYKVAADGAAFERVAILKANQGTQPLLFTDSGVSGQAVYFVSAFNSLGEIPSNPVTVTIDDPACPQSMVEKIPGLRLDGGILSVTQPVDLLYCYASVSTSVWVWIPGATMADFITGGQAYYVPVNGKVDLSGLYEEVVKFSTDYLPPESKATLDCWGWLGGTLKYLGRVQTTLAGTTLKVCNLVSGCGGDVQGTHKVEEAYVNWNESNRARELYWSTEAAEAVGGIWQVSSSPFPPGYQSNPLDLLAEGTTSISSPFVIDFGDPLILSIFSVSGWRYVRIIPIDNYGDPIGVPSNQVSIHYGPVEEGKLQIIPPPPNIYDVEVINFQPPLKPYLPWGCVIITGIDEAAVTQYLNNILPLQVRALVELEYQKYRIAYQTGAAVCPTAWQPQEKAWYEEVWDFIERSFSGWAEVFSLMKNLIVDYAAQGLYEIGISCNEDCKAALKSGLNAGMMALGIPPELPSLAALTDQGIDYLASLAAQSYGVDCDTECVKKIREAIEDAVEWAKEKSAATACVGEAEAHAHGAEPMCLPPGVKAEIAPGTTFQMAKVVVQVTRKPEPANVDPNDLSRYSLSVEFPVVNHSYDGQELLVQTNTTWISDCGFCKPDYGNLYVSGPLQGALFDPIQVPIPPLTPDESKEYSFDLRPIEYWIPGHQEMIAQAGGVVKYSDWWKLFKGGELTVKASVQGRVYVFPWWAELGTPDEMYIVLPTE